MAASAPHGATSGLGALHRASRAVSRSISPENFDGAKGGGGRAVEGTGKAMAGPLGQGWKVSPSIAVAPGETAVLGEIDGPGTIRHLWCTTAPHAAWRWTVLRMYWEGEDTPAVEVPLGDFFCNGWGVFSQVSSQPIAANPNGGFNSYWPLPFREHARITLENLAAEPVTLYYQIDYELDEAEEDTRWFHAQWRRSSPLARGEVHTLLDGIEGAGHYIGTYLAWQSNSPGWWGEGEVKFYLDGDTDFPTICGTGTEDYFGGAWNFDVPGTGYQAYTTPYLGLNQVLRPDGLYASQARFGMYRWHVLDPIRFAGDLRATIQALGVAPGQGCGTEHRFRQLTDDLASTSLYYLDRPAPATRPVPPDLYTMEVE